MTVFPVVARELRVASRRPWTYWSRLAAAALGLAITAWMLVLRGWAGARLTGEPLFYMVSAVGLGFALLAGLLFSADSVSSEKREGTLGLLFLTDLRGIDVTLGKLTATSLGAFYGLLAVMPLLALALLMGGVTMADYGRMVLVLVVTLYSSLSLGLLASVLTTDVRRAVFLTFLFLLVLISGGPLVNSSVSWVMGRMALPTATISQWEQNWMSVATPFVAFYRAHGTPYAAGSRQFLQSISYVAATSIVALAYASWRLPHVWQEKGTQDRRRPLKKLLERLRFPGESSQRLFRRHLLDRNPVTWLTARYWIREWLFWLFMVGSLGFVFLLSSGVIGERWWEPELGLLVGFGFHLALKFWVANEAPRQFLEDRTSGAIELLLSTSLTVEDILRGRWLALRRQFLGPLVAVLLLDLFWLGSIVTARVRFDGPEVLWVALVFMLILVVDLWALAWAGLWAGLVSRGRATTTGLIARILILPWVLWMTGMAALAALAALEFFNVVRNYFFDSTFWPLLAAWGLLGVANSAFWALRARTRLLTEFRVAATARPDSRSWFRWRTRKE